jgi:RNA polymerase sigma-70 factor (ECF subfamily)
MGEVTPSLKLPESGAGVPPADKSSVIPSSVSEETAAIFRAHATEVWRSLKYLGVRESELPDACQEVFLVVHRKLPEFRRESSTRTWLYGICLRVAKTWRRRYQSAPQADDDRAIAPPQERELEQNDVRDVLSRALDRLPDLQREVFVLHEIEEVPMREVAQRLNCPLFTAYSRWRLARLELKRLLKQRGVGR